MPGKSHLDSLDISDQWEFVDVSNKVLGNPMQKKHVCCQISFDKQLNSGEKLMEAEFQWEGHNISINSQPALKYLWFATETIVKVDGVEIGRTGGFRFTEKLTGKFPHNNNSSELALEMKADLITLVSIPYKLEIDGGIISQGRLEINNWILFLVPTIPLIACGICFAATLLYLSAIGK